MRSRERTCGKLDDKSGQKFATNFTYFLVHISLTGCLAAAAATAAALIPALGYMFPPLWSGAKPKIETLLCMCSQNTRTAGFMSRAAHQRATDDTTNKPTTINIKHSDSNRPRYGLRGATTLPTALSTRFDRKGPCLGGTTMIHRSVCHPPLPHSRRYHQ